MLWASFTLAFYGFLRCSELTCNGPFDRNVHLTRADVTFVPDIDHPQRMEVHIKKSKTDPFRQTALIIIAKTHTNICAVSAVKGTSSFKHPTPTQTVSYFSSGTDHIFLGAHWPRTYIPSLTCAAYIPRNITLTVSELEQQLRQPLQAYLPG